MGADASAPANILRCENLSLNKDRLLLHLLPYLATNASGQVGVSIGGDGRYCLICVILFEKLLHHLTI